MNQYDQYISSNYQPAPLDKILAAGQLREQKYEDNANKIQSSLDQLGAIYSPVQFEQDYYNKKLNEVSDKINQISNSGRDLSDPVVNNQINSVIRSFTFDPKIHAVLSNIDTYKSYQKDVDQMKKDGTYDDGEWNDSFSYDLNDYKTNGNENTIHQLDYSGLNKYQDWKKQIGDEWKDIGDEYLGQVDDFIKSGKTPATASQLAIGLNGPMSNQMYSDFKKSDEYKKNGINGFTTWLTREMLPYNRNKLDHIPQYRNGDGDGNNTSSGNGNKTEKTDQFLLNKSKDNRVWYFGHEDPIVNSVIGNKEIKPNEDASGQPDVNNPYTDYVTLDDQKNIISGQKDLVDNYEEKTFHWTKQLSKQEIKDEIDKLKKEGGLLANAKINSLTLQLSSAPDKSGFIDKDGKPVTQTSIDFANEQKQDEIDKLDEYNKQLQTAIKEAEKESGLKADKDGNPVSQNISTSGINNAKWQILTNDWNATNTDEGYMSVDQFKKYFNNDIKDAMSHVTEDITSLNKKALDYVASKDPKVAKFIKTRDENLTGNYVMSAHDGVEYQLNADDPSVGYKGSSEANEFNQSVNLQKNNFMYIPTGSNKEQIDGETLFKDGEYDGQKGSFSLHTKNIGYSPSLGGYYARVEVMKNQSGKSGAVGSDVVSTGDEYIVKIPQDQLSAYLKDDTLARDAFESTMKDKVENLSDWNSHIDNVFFTVHKGNIPDTYTYDIKSPWTGKTIHMESTSDGKPLTTDDVYNAIYGVNAKLSENIQNNPIIQHESGGKMNIIGNNVKLENVDEDTPIGLYQWVPRYWANDIEKATGLKIKNDDGSINTAHVKAFLDNKNGVQTQYMQYYEENTLGPAKNDIMKDYKTYPYAQDYSQNQILAVINFLGVDGAKKYFRTGVEPSNISTMTYGKGDDRSTVSNPTVEQLLSQIK